MISIRIPIVVLAALVLVCPAARAEEPAAPFDFVAIGCMPYYFPADHERFLTLIDEVNALQPAFTVHCGDTKGGQTPCDDEAFDRVLEYFARFDHPLAYSIGDNEWTDCGRGNAGGFDPLERLAQVRGRFFPQEQSLGARPMPLVSQRQDPAYARYVENTRWERDGVTFATAHVVGSDNNFLPLDPAAVDEYQARDEANEAWVRAVFTHARAHDRMGVVLFIQANPFDAQGGPRGPGYERFVRVLREESSAFAGQVVLVHADSHYFRIDKPLTEVGTRRCVENFTRVETFGSTNMHAVRITVDPGNPKDPFTFRAHMVAQR